MQTFEDESLELDVLENDLVVKIKQKIRDNLSCPSNINTKFMKLRYENNSLNDNDLLLSYKFKEGDVLTFEQNSESKSRDSIILYFQGDIPERQILQIAKDTTIEKVKCLLSPLVKIKKFDLYRHSEELRDEVTIEELGLVDYTRINVVEEEEESENQKKLHVELKEIFKGQPEEYFKQKTQVRFRRPNDYLLLFHEVTHQLNPFSYPYCEFTELKIDPLRIKGLNIDNEPIDLGNYSEILNAKDEDANRMIVIKRYICEKYELITKYEDLINGMINFQKNNPNSKVVDLYKFYRNKFSFGVGMELMEGGSLDNYVKNFWPFPDKQIIRWTRSILEGLQYLHNNKIMLCDLKPSNILLDQNNNLKLCAFSLSLYVISNHEMQLKKGSAPPRLGAYNYMAPEVLNSEPYGFPADVWSFGGVLVNIITGKHPCPDGDSIDAAFQVARHLTMIYTLPESTNQVFKDAIARCTVGDPTLRPTITELIENDFAPLVT